MEKDHVRIGESFGRTTFFMQSDAELAEWKRIFPDPLPSTHKIVAHWDGRKVTVGPELDEAAMAKVHAAAQEVAPQGVVEGSPEYAKELEKKDKAALLTIGAELGLQLDKHQTKAQMIAQIIERQQKNARAAAQAAAAAAGGAQGEDPKP